MLTWIRQLFAAPVFEDEDKTRAASLLNTILLSNLAIAVMTGLFVPFTSPRPAVGLTALGITILLVLGQLFLVRVGRVRLASVLFSSAVWVLITVLIHVSGGMRSLVLISYALVIVQAGLLLGGPAAITFAGLSIVTGVGILYVESRGLLPSPLLAVSSTGGWLTLTANLIMAAMMLYVATRSINEALGRAHRNERALAEINRELEAEITERKRVEEKLRAEKEFSESMLNAVVDTVFVFDPNTGKPLRWNRALNEISGYTDEEIASKKAPDDWYDEKDLKRAEATTEKIFREGRGTVEMSLIAKDGRLIPTEYTGSPIKDAEGKPQYLIAVGRDITERKRVEEALRESEAELFAIFDNAPIVMILVDRERRVRKVNRGTLEFTNRPAEEMIGLRGGEALRCLHSLDDPRGCGFGPSCEMCRVRNTVLDTFETGKSHHRLEASLPFARGEKQGELTFLVSTTLLSVPKDQMVLVCIEDITERKRAAEQLQTSLREKEVLLREIHHRVKNNLQVVSSLLNLQADYAGDEQIVEMFQESRNRVRFMALVHEKLYRSQDLARVDFAEYIQNLAAHLFHSYKVREKEIALKIEIADVALGIDAAIPCALIVNELISNSLKHAFPEGQGGEIRVGLSSDQAKFTLTVGDNGVGFPPDLDFRNTESLGLQLVVTFVEQLDGSIELDGSDGTTFKIEFPG